MVTGNRNKQHGDRRLRSMTVKLQSEGQALVLSLKNNTLLEKTGQRLRLCSFCHSRRTVGAPANSWGPPRIPEAMSVGRFGTDFGQLTCPQGQWQHEHHRPRCENELAVHIARSTNIAG